MFEVIDEKYKKLTDEEIIKLVLSGNEEAMAYLLYVRYREDLKFYTWQCFYSYEYYEDLIDDLYIHLKGDNDWHRLKTFCGKSKFRTWLRTVSTRLFMSKRKTLIDTATDGNSINVETEERRLEPSVQEAGNQNSVMLLEAINRLDNDLYRFILINELLGYNHKEIAEMLIEKRKKENKKSTYRGEEVVPDAHYIDMNKARALRDVKKIVNKLKEEWYGNK